MSVRYKIIDAKKLVYVTAERKPTFNEQLNHLETLANDPRYIPPMKKLVDYTNLERIGLTNQQIDQYTEKKAQYKKLFKDEQTAVVVNNDLDFGISRIFYAKMSAHGLQMNVFRNIDDALRWLDIELDKTEMLFD